ncbi:MAG TPA: SDR family oxidoreductase [Burkholderiales bacterium]|nr:SDR family oxidoreductase [Burkholderiales bacterium]
MDRVAIVTGGTSGIGAAAADELSRRGWKVAVMARKGVAAEFQGDVAKDADCRRVAKAVLDKWGRIDALVNNAGTTKFVKHADLEGLSAADYERIFGINLVGPFQMVRACRDALKASRGAVVNVSSVAAARGTGSSIAYAASKSALNTMTQSLARALGPEIRVNGVAPGFVRTPWQEAQGKEVTDETERKFVAAAPLAKPVDAADVADAIAWLIEGARSTTGVTILVDCGIHLAAGR